MASSGRGESFGGNDSPTVKHHTKTSRLLELKPSRTSGPNHFGHAPAVELVNQDVEASSLPVPVPDYGNAPAYQPSSLVIKAGFLPAMGSTTATPDMSQPTLISFGDTVSYTTDVLETFTSTEALEPSFYPPSRPRHIQNSSVVAIVMSILGGTFLLVAFIVAAKIRSRRTGRRYLQTPSLPVLQDQFPDHPAEESPVFGGKERFSASIFGKEKWTWTQYRSKSPLREVEKDPFSDAFAKPLRSSNTLHPHESSVKKRGFLQRSLSHMSALSAYSTAKSDVVGLVANASASAFASTTTIADRASPNKSEGNRSSVRKSKDKQAIRITVRDWDAGSEDEYVYDGVEDLPAVITHLPVPTPNAPSAQILGRERVKAPYPVGSCPSISVSMNSIAVPSMTPSNSTTVPDSTDPFDDSSPYATGPSTSKTATRKERDTQALTIALGLDSPKLELEPQDQTSLSRGRISLLRRSHTVAHHASFMSIPDTLSSPCPSDDGSRLGNFMLRDYRRSSLSLPREQMPPLPPPPPIAPLNLRSHTNGNSTDHKVTVVDDRPPRVPSPPAFPSLAQMAMSQAADYETYRSPTYSLYDVYADKVSDKERDKRTTLFFGGKDRG
ncbi:hypothetical protein BJ322DRAFT_429689 [Thelephora terrestris]|uniref:Uncharacterized protein n=1 Tax=Thelephora terrestris TaxID=56493 RepID=A0A9P6HNS6_9AGAM|nr:hypothetical protein BJ322DRAFT_429689 [Thelephora terrestris]